ncbi:MAG: sporulation integral membrane protein YtvI [Velocimicrobium sp.]
MKQDVKELWYMIGTTVAVYGAIRYLLPLVVPFLFSYFFARLLYPLAASLKKKWKISGTITIGLLTTMVLSVIGIGLFYLCKTMVSQIQKLVTMLPVYEIRIMNRMDRICTCCDKTFALEHGTAFRFIQNKWNDMLVQGKNQVSTNISWETISSVAKVFGIFWCILVVIWGMILIVKDMDELKIIYEESWVYRHGSNVFKGLGEIGMAYGKAELIIMMVVFLVCSIGFFLIDNSYAVLLALFVSIFDAFPVLGSGLVLIPWAIFEVLRGNWFAAAVLATLYVVCQVVREWVEAKLIGNQIGIKPIFTIMSMYAGVKLFGIFGFILGPIALMIVKTVLQNQW